MEPRPALTPPAALTIPECARILSVSARSIWRLIAAGELAVVRLGRSTRVTRESIDALVARGGTAR